ncbi:MAG: hypothetical protein ACJA08_000134 [Cyclobacteriaceae bacterium]
MEFNYYSMDEYFLHFLWKYQKFAMLPLTLATGELLSVLKPGFHNHNSGPDFLEGKIKIDEIEWSGSIEIHHKASDWYLHGHQHDPAYHNVVLHVVWIDDKPVSYPNGQPIPTLVLSKFTDRNLEQQYRAYINQPKTIRCDTFLESLPNIHKTAMLDHALTDRLEAKANLVLKTLEETNNDWEETAYRLLGRNFGFSLNKEPFETLTQILPFKVIAKHLGHPKQIFALIFGSAGFLEEHSDEYQKELSVEYQFLSKKYKLDSPLLRHHWKYSKLRPANFPTVRLAQFATFLIIQKNLFSFFIDKKEIKILKSGFSIALDEYWDKHYDFGRSLKTGTNHFGEASADNILINTVVPLLAAYSKEISDSDLIERAIEILSSLKEEKNRITRAWADVGIKCSSAFDSQAVIQQFNEFCVKKKCLHCNIGVAILNR